MENKFTASIIDFPNSSKRYKGLEIFLSVFIVIAVFVFLYIFFLDKNFGCFFEFNCSKTSSKAPSNNESISSSVKLSNLSINIAKHYISEKEETSKLSGPFKLDGFENLNLLFFRPYLQGSYTIGSANYVITRIRVDYGTKDIIFPLSNEFPVLIYQGLVQTKPYYANSFDFLTSIQTSENFTLGLLYGSLNDEEKKLCVDSPSLCNAVDLYSQNQEDIEFLLRDLNSQSTQTMTVPIYFAGVSK